MSRQQERRQLRRGAEFVTAAIIRMSRKQRRLTGRVYANAAYRRLHEIDHEMYGGFDHGYTEHTAHKGVLDWIVGTERKRRESIETAKRHEEEAEQGVHVDVQSHDGPSADRTVEGELQGEMPCVPKETA